MINHAPTPFGLPVPRGDAERDELCPYNFNPNRSLDRICLDLLFPLCFLPALVRLPTSALPFHLAVARYAFDETVAHLLNNRTKSVKDSNDRFGFKISLKMLA